MALKVDFPVSVIGSAGLGETGIPLEVMSLAALGELD
jgi:hypothetical protein